jgi:hypothetical protein
MWSEAIVVLNKTGNPGVADGLDADNIPEFRGIGIIPHGHENYVRRNAESCRGWITKDITFSDL